MKLYKSNGTQIEVTKRTEKEGVVVMETENGEITLITTFNPLFDESGNKVTDFSFLPLRKDDPDHRGGGKKESKTAKYIAGLSDNDSSTYGISCTKR